MTAELSPPSGAATAALFDFAKAMLGADVLSESMIASLHLRGAVAFAEKGRDYKLECLYERSCGAVVYRRINDEIRYLLIKNRRSTHWGFPKGHVEKGETFEQTAMREVLEETGIHIQILPQFASKSEYTIQGRVEKTVTIYLAKTRDTQTTIQREEIEDYIWLNFDKAMDTLRFINDRNILQSAHDFLVKQHIC